MAFAILGLQLPRLLAAMPLTKSKYSLPSESHTLMPLPFTSARGYRLYVLVIHLLEISMILSCFTLQKVYHEILYRINGYFPFFTKSLLSGEDSQKRTIGLEIYMDEYVPVITPITIARAKP